MMEAWESVLDWALEWAQGYALTLAVAGWATAVALAIVSLIALARWVHRKRRGSRPAGWLTNERLFTLAASTPILILSYDGGVRLLLSIGLPRLEALILGAAVELIMIQSAIRAERSLRAHADPDGHHRVVFILAIGLGAVAASAANDGLPDILVRALAPPVVAYNWWRGLKSEMRNLGLEVKRPENTTWLITPRRLAVALGLMAATEEAETLAQQTRARRTVVLARLMSRYTLVSEVSILRPLALWYAGRIRRRAERVTTAGDVEALREQLLRTRHVLEMARLAEPEDAAPPARAGERAQSGPARQAVSTDSAAVGSPGAASPGAASPVRSVEADEAPPGAQGSGEQTGARVDSRPDGRSVPVDDSGRVGRQSPVGDAEALRRVREWLGGQSPTPERITEADARRVAGAGSRKARLVRDIVNAELAAARSARANGGQPDSQ